jgi:hypothetical protein
VSSKLIGFEMRSRSFVFFLSALSLSLSLPLLPSSNLSLTLSLSHTPSSIVAGDIIITVINDKQTRRKKTREEREREKERKKEKREKKIPNERVERIFVRLKKKKCIFTREMTLLATLFERFRAYHRILPLFLSAARVDFLTFLVSRKPPSSLFCF